MTKIKKYWKICQRVRNAALNMSQESKSSVQWSASKKIFKKELMKQQKKKNHIQIILLMKKIKKSYFIFDIS